MTFARIIGTGRRVEGRRKDGTRFPFWLGVSHTVVEGRDLFVGVVHDLSEVQTVLDTALDGIVQIDHTGVVLTFNPAAAKMSLRAPC